MTLKWKSANKTEQLTNGNKVIWLVYRMDTNAPGFWLVKWTLGWKKLHARELNSRNQPVDTSLWRHTATQLANSTMPSPLGFSLAGKWALTKIVFQGHKKKALTAHALEFFIVLVLFCFKQTIIAALSVHVLPSYWSRPSLSMILFCLYITCLYWWFFGETGVPTPGKAMKIVAKPPAKQAISVS